METEPIALSGCALSKTPIIDSSLQETGADPFSFSSVESVRPTGHRLLIAIGVASILLAALVEMYVDLKIGVANYSAKQDALLTVYITGRNVEQTSELNTDEQAIHKSREDEQLLNKSAPSEIAKSGQREPLGDSADSPVNSKPVPDWYALLEQSAKASVDEYFRREDVRASMWRQTRSVMFQPGNDFGVIEEEPILADIKFRQPVGVLGLGFTIGSCFIGIPIAGVPVEERTIAIRLFVCREDAG